MLYNFTMPARQAQDKTTRNMKRAMLLASTVLLTMPQSVLADETYDSGSATIDVSTDKHNENLSVGFLDDAALTINNGADVKFSTTSIGVEPKVSGAVTVTDNAKLTAAVLQVGVSGSGSLTVNGGGQVASTGSILAAAGTFSAATLSVSGKDSLLTSTSNILVGSGGNASLTVMSGANASSSNAYLAYNGGRGEMTVSGVGSTFDVTNNFIVGRAGVGTLSIDDGGSVSTGFGALGQSVTDEDGETSYGTGTATVTGGGSVWHNTSGLIVGDENKGTLVIGNSGQVTVGALDGNTGLYDGIVTIARTSNSDGAVNIGENLNSPSAPKVAGRLRAQKIQFGAGQGQLNFYHTDTNYEFSADIAGFGQIRHYAGTTEFSGNSSSFLGSTLVRGGTLDVTGRLAGTTSVSDRGTLGGTGTLGNTTIEQGGTLSPGLHAQNSQTRGGPVMSSPIGTLTVEGDLELQSDARYAVDLSSEAEKDSNFSISDRVDVTGKLTINSGAVVSVTALDGQTDYRQTQTYKIMTAGSSDGHGFQNVDNNSAFLDVTTNTDSSGKNIFLSVSMKDKGGFTPIAQTSNQFSLASALDSLDHSGQSLELRNSLMNLDASQAREAYQQLSGDLYATAQGAFTQTNRAVNTALNSRVRAVTDGVAAPSSMALGYAEESEPVKDERFAAFEPKKTFDTDRFATWVNGFGSWGKVSGVDGGTDTDVSNGGMLVGGDFGIGGDSRIGVLGGYSRSFFDSENSSGNSTNYHLGTYAGTKLGGISLRTGMNYTWHNVGSTRNVPLIGQTLQGDYDATSLNAYGEVAYRVALGKSALEPYAALAHTRMETDGFSETGGNAALTVDSSKMNTTYTTLGLRATSDFELGGIASVARGTVGWMHAYGDTDPVSTARFLTGDSFSVSSTPVDRNTALLEAGLDFTVTPSSTVSVSYNGQIGSNAYDHGASAKFRVKF